MEKLTTCVSQSTRLLILHNTAGTTLSVSSYTPLLEIAMGRNVSLFKEYSLAVASPSSRSSLSSESPPSLTTRVVSLSTPQTRLRAELIDELVNQWNKKMEEMKEDEGESEGESGSDREKNVKLSERDLLQGFFTILRQVDQLEAPEKSSCILPPLE